jgi:hypothetical protein
MVNFRTHNSPLHCRIFWRGGPSPCPLVPHYLYTPGGGSLREGPQIPQHPPRVRRRGLCQRRRPNFGLGLLNVSIRWRRSHRQLRPRCASRSGSGRRPLAVQWQMAVTFVLATWLVFFKGAPLRLFVLRACSPPPRAVNRMALWGRTSRIPGAAGPAWPMRRWTCFPSAEGPRGPWLSPPLRWTSPIRALRVPFRGISTGYDPQNIIYFNFRGTA